MMFAADNIRLRALEPEDLEWLYSVENDEELWQWGSSNVPYSRYTLKTYIAESRHDIYADGQLRLVIETEDEHLVLGCVDLMDFSPRHLRAEIGILLFPEYRGRGVATKVLGM
ncbi:GNAT family N-acetyltransferase, partial [Paraprevotella clara]